MSDHHNETFISKYIFSLDHKMIAKQFLITGMFMGVVGMLMSILFRLQLSNPGKSFEILEWFIEDGFEDNYDEDPYEKTKPENILALGIVTMPSNNIVVPKLD